MKNLKKHKIDFTTQEAIHGVDCSTQQNRQPASTPNSGQENQQRQAFRPGRRKRGGRSKRGGKKNKKKEGSSLHAESKTQGTKQ